MNNVKEIENYISNNNIKLLGQIPVTGKDYEELLDISRSKVMSLQTNVPSDLLLSLTLVQIAIRTYKEGNYWDYFLDEIGTNISSSKRNWLGQIFATTLRSYKMFEIERDAGSKYAYVENIKAHAFVPNNYLNGYFDFLLSFYEGNLMRQLTDDVEDDIYEMIDFFEDSLNENADSIRVEKIGNKPAKTYKLLKATRCAIAQCSPSIIAGIIIKHLKMIDIYYYDGEIPNQHERIAEAFGVWTGENVSSFSATKTEKKRHSSVFYRKPHFEIDREAGKA